MGNSNLAVQKHKTLQSMRSEILRFTVRKRRGHDTNMRHGLKVFPVEARRRKAFGSQKFLRGHRYCSVTTVP